MSVDQMDGRGPCDEHDYLVRLKMFDEIKMGTGPLGAGITNEVVKDGEV